MWNQIAQHITQVTQASFDPREHRSVGGGCINKTYRLSDRERSYFVKLNRATGLEMFVAEALGLQQMGQTQTIRVPAPICWGSVGDSAYLVLEWLDLGGHSSHAAWTEMGRQLARLHQGSGSHRFGWDRNNTIGSTPQINPWLEDWVLFWQEHRLSYQFKLANRQGGHFPRQRELLAAVPEILADHDPQPSLVHGDLWSGNAAVTTDGVPVIFDPATYWGDREVDLAMTELFGSFPTAFYQSYQDTFPVDSGYSCRKSLYNLYHILNHFNLFGGGYASQANRMIDQLLG